MTRRILWLTLLLGSSGCFFSFTTDFDGGVGTTAGEETTGTAGATGIGTGSSSGGSGSSGNGSAGASTGNEAGGSSGGSTTGASTTGGGATGTAGATSTGGSPSSSASGTGGGSLVNVCAAPDAGWPTHCSAPITVMDFSGVKSVNLGDTIQSVSVQALPGGDFLVMAVDDDTGLQGFAIIYDPGAGTTSDAGYFTGSPAGSGVDQSAALAGSPSTLFIGQNDPNGYPETADCYQPLTSDAPVSLTYSDTNGNADVDRLTAAQAGDGELGLLWDDPTDGDWLWGTAASGGCPASLQPLPTASPGAFGYFGYGGIAPLDPFGSGPGLAIVEPIYANATVDNDGVDVLYGNSGILSFVYDGGANIGPATVASDGTGLSILAAEEENGVQLLRAPLALDGGAIQRVRVLSSDLPDVMAATACAPGCTLAAWADTADVYYAFLNAQGCGVGGTIPNAIGPFGYDGVAVAATPTTAAIVFPMANVIQGSGQIVSYVGLVYCQ
ncbi:MAG TPA: hypothetical protein VMB50_11495 [Myxococcales bacterium]|nr:hypothetical protein [Myxococcales bacterium]